MSLSALPQPYPTVSPWVDLRPHLDSSWQMDSSAWHFRGLVDGNTCHIHLRTRRGTSATLAEELPEAFRPPGQSMFQAFAPTAEGHVGVILETDGHLRLYSPGQNLTDGSLSNLIVQISYTRRGA